MQQGELLKLYQFKQIAQSFLHLNSEPDLELVQTQ